MAMDILFRRLLVASVAALCLNTFFIQISYAADTVDQKCLKDASNERTNRVKKAYEDFANDMKKAADKLRDDEANRLSYGDFVYAQAEIARSYANYSYEINERSRDLSAKMTDAWNDYQNRRAKCNVSSIPGTAIPAYYPPNNGVPYATYGGYGYPYGGSTGYSSYSYPYSYYYGTNGRNPYGGYGTYGYGGDIYRGCSQRVLSPPPPGCGYSHGIDSNGCPSYTPVCSNALSTTTSCTCSSQYAPVCSKDGRTFFNACYAACMGASVQFQGTCLQY